MTKPKKPDPAKVAVPGATPEDRRRLLAHGYEPLPILGKFPCWPGWASGEITSERLDETETKHPDHAGTGLRTGKLSVTDIDLTDPAHVAAVEEVIIETLDRTLLERVGSKGKALLYRNPEPIRKITVTCAESESGRRTLVEFLGTGQQLAAYGRHPDTDRPYEWPNAYLDAEPLYTALADLSEVSPEKLRAAAEAVAAKLRELGYSDAKVSGAVSSRPSARSGEPVTETILRQMLACIDPACERLTWVALGGALHDANVVTDQGKPDDDFDGLLLFDEWSSGRLAGKECPPNYQGFDDCKGTWESFGRGAEHTAGVGTIVYHAIEGGYTGPTRVAAVAFEGIVGGSEERAEDEDEAATLDGFVGAIERINEEFAVITDGANTGRPVKLSNSAEPVFLPVERFHSLLAPMRVPVGDKGELKSASRLWLASQKRRQISKLVFEPAGSPSHVSARDHNIWQGFRVQPREGDSHVPFLDHLEQIVCGGERHLFEWFLAWMANLAQEPGRKPGAGVMLVSAEQGTGKSIVVQTLAALTAPYSIVIANREQLTGRFNAHLANKVLVGLEEATWGGRVQDRGVLKHLMTGDEQFVEQKGVDGYMIRNHARILATSNERWAVPAEVSDRRWVVLRVRPDRANDDAYFGPMWNAIFSGDLPANLMRFLLDHRYERSLLYKPPMTAAKAEQIMKSAGPVANWWFEVLSGEIGLSPSPFDGDHVPKDGLYRSFSNWPVGKGGDTDKAQFWKDLRQMVGSRLRDARVGGRNSRERSITFPPLDECRVAFAKHIGYDWFQLA